MADEIAPQITPTPVAVSETPGTPNPVQVTTAPTEPAKVVEAVAAPTPAPAPTEPSQVAPEAPKDAPAAADPKVETLLGEPEKAPAPVEPVTSEAKPEETKNTEGDQTAEPAPPPTYEPFKLPEDVKLDETRVGDFTKLLSELELTGKADHAAVQEFGQKAVDFHISEVKKAVEDYQKSIYDTWDRQKVEWKESFLKDPDIGGNRSQTTVDAARNFIRNHGGSQEQQNEFRTLMETSGLGNHPAMIRILANAYRDLQEGKPLAATTPVQATKSKTQTLYGKT